MSGRGETEEQESPWKDVGWMDESSKEESDACGVNCSLVQSQPASQAWCGTITQQVGPKVFVSLDDVRMH